MPDRRVGKDKGGGKIQNAMIGEMKREGRVEEGGGMFVGPNRRNVRVFNQCTVEALRIER